MKCARVPFPLEDKKRESEEKNKLKCRIEKFSREVWEVELLGRGTQETGCYQPILKVESVDDDGRGRRGLWPRHLISSPRRQE